MATATFASSTFSASLEQHTLPIDGLEAIRRNALQRLLECGLPGTKSEAFRYVPLRMLYASVFAPAKEHEVSYDAIFPHVLPECTSSVLVFVDGHLNLNVSRLQAVDRRVAIMPLTDAMRTYGQFLRTRFAKNLETEADPFALLNLAFHEEAVFLYLPPKVVLSPLQILIFSTQEGASSLPRLHLFAGARAKADIALTCVDLPSTLNFPVIDLALEEGADVRVNHVMETEIHAWHLGAVRATLKKSARFSHVQWNRGEGIIRGDTHVFLQGEQAFADLKGVGMLKARAHGHAYIRVDHEAPMTQSMQLFKSVLSDFSHSSFEGKIFVRPEAQKTEAYQLSKNLLLDPHVMAYAKPNLEIFADDVKASHGATVGPLLS